MATDNERHMPLTVGELIEILKSEYPMDMRVLIEGYEGGYENPHVEEKEVVLEEGRKEASYLGQYESKEYAGTDGTNCVLLARP